MNPFQNCSYKPAEGAQNETEGRVLKQLLYNF